MKSLLLLNGSPRGERSNSLRMLRRVAEGWQCATGTEPETLHLSHRKDFERALVTFATADAVLLGMPLYTDAMPALVKEYIEALASRVGQKNPTIGFLVQSGFPEARQSRPLERYLEKLAGRLKAPYAGTIVHGGGAALEGMPEHKAEKIWKPLRMLGKQLAREGHFQAVALNVVAGREQFTKLEITLFGLARLLPWP